ncbi:MAG TPA: hypothetical protein VFM69_05420 [Pricia sp.]|nr:hypothetical protein [Pricia sp.]
MKVAIVEIRESHEECLYTQLKFLTDAGHRVTLVLHPTLRQPVSDYGHLANEVHYLDLENQDALHKLRLQWRLYRLLKKFDRVVLNTAHSYSVLRNLTLLLRFAKTECVGILHDTRKLHTSFTQKIISKKVKKYFVLNDALLPKEPPTDDIRVQSFYPIFFSDYEPVPVYKQNGIWIGIPGRMDYGRRDYDFLVDALAQIPVLDHVRFLILGKVDRDSPFGHRFCESLEKAGQSGRFKIFHSFIDNTDFHAYLKACDYIMPLLHTGQGYFKYKISGAHNLAFAYKKPLICHTSYRHIPDLQENALFFDAATFPKLIGDIDSRTVKSPTTYTDPKWDYQVQQTRYIDFIKK